MKNNNNIITIIIAVILAIIAAASITIAITLITNNETAVVADVAEPVTNGAPATGATTTEAKAPAKVRVAVISNWEQYIEAKTNQWLAEHPDCEIISIQQSLPQKSSGSSQSVCVLITYIEK